MNINEELINKALDFATIKHQGQKRIGGKEYITHPIEVVNNIDKYYHNNPKINVLKAVGYLHDTLEDTDTTFEELVQNFGYEIADLVLSLTNDNKIKNKIGKTKYLETKMLHMSKDTFDIKLCDRLSNIKDLIYTDNNFINKYIKETLEIFTFLNEYKDLNDEEQLIIMDTIKEIKKLKSKQKTLKLQKVVNY